MASHAGENCGVKIIVRLAGA